MGPDEARFLASAAGARLLDAARAARSLPLHRRAGALAGLGTPDLVRAALRQDDLRVRAAAKTPHAEALLFAPDALEQATPWAVAVERAARWPGPAAATLHDLGAGVGLDALAAALAGRPVVAWERDPVRALLLAANVRALGVERRIEVRAEDAAPGPAASSFGFLDADRRPGGRRTRSAERFEPPASDWARLLAPFRAAMAKAPPVAVVGIPPAPFEVVSLGGEVRERRLLFGDLADAPPRRALALPAGASVEGTGVAWPEPAPPREGGWLLDPDPAITVAGLVGDLAVRDALRPVHARIAYLVADRPVAGAPGTWLRIDGVLPGRAREVNAWLRAHGVGRLTIRSRGVADGVETWRRRLRPVGDAEGTVTFLRDSRDRWTAVVSAGGSGAGAPPP